MPSKPLSAAALAVAVALAACAGGEPAAEPDASPTPVVEPEPTTEPTTEPAASPTDDLVTIEVRGGQVQGGVRTIQAAVGETIAFRVVSDVADVVHVHGFDEHFDVGPGQDALVELTAAFSGQFEVELEEAGLRIADLEVR